MKIYYIYHSGFAVETQNYKLVFDYYRQPAKDSDGFEIERFLEGDNKKIIVFSSHSHGDHFNKKILNWQEINSNIEYVLSDDIKRWGDYHYVKEGDILDIEGAKIKVFGSTDLGTSFFVECDNTKFFHTGDLNLWAWSDDTKEEEEYMKNLYEEKMEKIEGEISEVDFLFYPVDSRLEDNYILGLCDFLERVDVKNIIPMHMWDDYEVQTRLRSDIEGRFEDKNIVKISKNRELIYEN